MRNTLILILIASILSNCSGNKQALELEILSKEVNCLKVRPNEYYKFVKADTIAEKDSRTVLSYKLTNNSTKTYYFNIDEHSEQLVNGLIKMDKVFLSVKDTEGNLIHARGREPSRNFYKEFLYAEYLNYNVSHKVQSQNFIIHPNETLYFEWFVVLPFGNITETTNYLITIDSNKKYLVEFLMHSDTTNYKKTLSRVDLKTIEDNNYEVFQGTVKSSNKIPVKFR